MDCGLYTEASQTQIQQFTAIYNIEQPSEFYQQFTQRYTEITRHEQISTISGSAYDEL